MPNVEEFAFKKGRAIALFLCVNVLLLFTMSVPAEADTQELPETEKYTVVDKPQTDKYLGDMMLVAENEALELYFDELETDIAVLVKSTGELWYSNPPDASEDPLASDYYKDRMKSQISIQYFNSNVQSSEMNNYSDSIRENQFEIDYLTNGVRITYTLGELASSLILPGIISEERMLYFTSLMEESTAKKLLRNYTFVSLDSTKDTEKDSMLKTYPVLSEHNIYLLKAGAKDYIKQEMMGYFAEAGYTAEDQAFDDAENGYSDESQKPWFQIPITYTIEGENLLVTVEPDEVMYNDDGFYLTSISVLEYFGAASSEEEGYIFVPDGSGALIYLNNGKQSVPAYNAYVYGEDNSLTFMRQSSSEVNENLTVKLPVYGIKTENSAFLAIIEEGAAYANLRALVSGMVSSYNNVYAGFQYLQYGAISLDQIIGGSNYFQMYSAPVFSSNYSIRFAFLKGEKASYSGMAEVYRQYLADRGELHNYPVADEAVFFVEFIAAIERYKSFFGVKHKALESLTSYAQAAEIVSILQRAGVEDIVVRYSGWAGGGLRGGEAAAAKPSSVVQKDLRLADYLIKMEQEDVVVYMDADLQYVYNDGLFDGYNALRDSPKYFDNSIAKNTRYNVSTGAAEGQSAVISPSLIGSFAEKLIKKTNRYTFPGLCMGKLNYKLYSDLFETRYIDRQNAMGIVSEAMEHLQTTYTEGLMGENANVYALTHIRNQVGVPFDTNKTLLPDESIPFYSIVIRGSMNFAGEALNNADDYKTTLLKSVESGADLYFQWIYESNSKVVNTDFDELYSVNYKAWLDTAVEDYLRVKELYKGLSGQTIQKHEKLQNGVYKTTFEKGREIVVNYTKQAVVVDGVTVGAMDFACPRSGD